MEHIQESIPRGSTRPCQSPTAKQAWAAVCQFARDTVPARDVLPTVAAYIRDATGGISWTACGPREWELLLRKFGGDQLTTRILEACFARKDQGFPQAAYSLIRMAHDAMKYHGRPPEVAAAICAGHPEALRVWEEVTK